MNTSSNNTNLNWWNYRQNAFTPKDLSPYHIGNVYDSNITNSPYTQRYAPFSNRSSIPSYAPPIPSSNGSGFDNIKAYLPQNYGEVGSLIGGIGSIYGAIAGAKASKKANENAEKTLEEAIKRNRKLDEEREALANSVNSVWNRE